MRFLALALAVASVTIASSAQQLETPADSSLAVIRDRFVHSVLPVESVSVAQAHHQSAKYLATLQPDGSWPDINYADTARSTWATADHLNRMLVMAKAARLSHNAGQPDTTLEGGILLALRWWTDHDYRNPNWWWNEIGVPELMGEIGALLGPQLPDDLRAKIVVIMKRSDWRRVPWTGANLTWGVGIEIVRGCLEGKSDLVSEGYNRLYQEIRLVKQPEDGIQQDYSFHQHSTQLYNGGYGLDFANDVGRFISFSWGTQFQIPADRMTLFTAFLLDGEQWMIRGNIFDYSAVGREIARKEKLVVPQDKIAGPINQVGAAYSLGNSLTLLAETSTPRKEELQGFLRRLEGLSNTPELIGNKQFWCSDFMSHRRNGYSTSVKMLSTRTINAELVNSEGKKSVHLSDGANYLYLNGSEYEDIFPVWDWTMIPGTTAIQGTLDTGERNPIGLHGTTTFDGGVSDGTYGMAAMDLARGGLAAKKAWFFFDTSYVALGAGIKLTGDVNHAVATDVNQTLLARDVLTSESTAAVEGTSTFHSAHGSWVYHNHVGYIFAPNTKVNLSAGPQTGAWSEIGTGSPAPVTMPVFNLWIDHGGALQDDAYQYIVVPNASADQVAKLAAKPELDVLANTKSIQAVYSGSLKLAEIAFRESGSLSTPLAEVKVDHSCLLLVRQIANGWQVTASNPENQPLTLHVTVRGKQVTIKLPEGNLAGSSITATVR